MAPKNSDAWLWVTLAIFSYYATLAIHKQLENTRLAAKITKEEKPSDMVSKHTENAIKLETLGQLSESSSPDIKAASINILTERALQGGPAWNHLLHDLAGRNAERRNKALVSLRFLFSRTPHVVLRSSPFVQQDFIKALIDCLCNLLPEARQAKMTGLYHSQAEYEAISLLLPVSLWNNADTLEAGLIDRWLARYPFSDESSSKAKKDIIRDTVRSKCENMSLYGCRLACLLRCTSKNPIACERMIKYGLWEAAFTEQDAADDAFASSPTGQIYVHMPEDPMPLREISDEMTAIDYVPEGFPDTNARRREESFEEQALRRRRREAMVLGENGRPIQRENIIERGDLVRDEDVEEELEHLMEEVTEAEAAENRSWGRWLSRLRPDGLAPPW